MSHGPHKEDKKHQPKHQVVMGQSAWELNRLSATGRNFLLEPDSRTSIVQELQIRLRREQQRREQMLLLSTSNNTAQGQSASAGQRASTSTPLPRQQLGNEKQEVSVPLAVLVDTIASSDSDAQAPSKYIDAPKPVITRRRSAKSSTSAWRVESEPVTNQQADSASAVDPRQNQESPIAYHNGSALEDNQNDQPATSMRATSNSTGEENNATAGWPTVYSGSDEEQNPSGPPSNSMHQNSIRSASTQTPGDSLSGEKMPSQQQSLPLRWPPCLQCLMRCLQVSDLLGSCWKRAVFELEEAFALREVADAVIGESVAGAGGESMQQRLPTQNSQGVSGENSTVELTHQVEINKWQALERLCHLRNSLRTCSHLSDA